MPKHHYYSSCSSFSDKNVSGDNTLYQTYLSLWLSYMGKCHLCTIAIAHVSSSEQKCCFQINVTTCEYVSLETMPVIVYVFCSCNHGKLVSLQWRHNGHDSISNHQPHDRLLNRFFRGRSKKTSKLRVTGLCVGNSPGTGEFPAQMASYPENVSIWWRHHVMSWQTKCELFSYL